MKRTPFGLLVGLFVLFTVLPTVHAQDQITKPHTFSPGTTIHSSQINENFDAVYNQVNKIVSPTSKASIIQAALSRVPAAGNVYTQEDVTISGTSNMIAGKLYMFKNLTVSGTLAFTYNAAYDGNPTVIVVEGDCVVSGTISVNEAGYAGGIRSHYDPTDGNDNLVYAPHMIFGKGSGKRAFYNSVGLQAAFTQFPHEPSDANTIFNALPGAGGGGGYFGSKFSDYGGIGLGGNGGRGGGCLILIVFGALDGAGGTISANGGNGGDGGAGYVPGSYSGFSGGGGGGGGAGGTIVIAHWSSYLAPSFSVSGGSGGAGGAGDTETGGNGGSGGAGQSGYPSSAGSWASGSSGGAGGAGSDGKVYVFQIGQ